MVGWWNGNPNGWSRMDGLEWTVPNGRPSTESVDRCRVLSARTLPRWLDSPETTPVALRDGSSTYERWFGQYSKPDTCLT